MIAKKRTKGDIILLASVLAATVLCAVLLFIPRGRGRTAVVNFDGREFKYALDKDQVSDITVNGKNIRIEIKDRTVRMAESVCDDKICIRTGRISRVGQSIICAPAKVYITITEEEYDEGSDKYEAGFAT